MEGKIEPESGTDLSNTFRKLVLCFGGGVAISSLLYLFVSHSRSRRNSMADNLEDNGAQSLPLQEEEIAKKKVLLLGLQGSGKSSILRGLQMYSMKVSEDEAAPAPTEGFHVMCIQTGMADLNMWEIGGSEKMRKYWTNFTQDTDTLVYVVDSSSSEEDLKLASDELHRILIDPFLESVPLVILANKQDLVGARRPDEVLRQMELQPHVTENRDIQEIGSQVPFCAESSGMDDLQAFLAT